MVINDTKLDLRIVVIGRVVLGDGRADIQKEKHTRSVLKRNICPYHSCSILEHQHPHETFNGQYFISFFLDNCCSLLLYIAS